MPVLATAFSANVAKLHPGTRALARLHWRIRDAASDGPLRRADITKPGHVTVPFKFVRAAMHNGKHEIARAHRRDTVHGQLSAGEKSLCRFNRTVDVPSFGFD